MTEICCTYVGTASGGEELLLLSMIDFLLGGERERRGCGAMVEAGSRRRPSNRGRKRSWEAVRICGDGVDEAVVEW